MNASLDCYHPKISFLIDKYKIYLLKIYKKFKSSLVNNQINSKDKFSIVNYILTLFNNINNKYKQKLDFNLILLSEKEEYEIINKVGDYLLDLFFDLNIKDDENDEILYKNIKKELKCDDYNINEVSDELDNDRLSFNEIYPKKINRKKK